MERRDFLLASVGALPLNGLTASWHDLSVKFGADPFSRLFLRKQFQLRLTSAEADQLSAALSDDSWWQNVLRLMTNAHDLRLLSISNVNEMTHNLIFNIPFSSISFNRFLSVFFSRLEVPVKLTSVYPGKTLDDKDFETLFFPEKSDGKLIHTSYDLAVCEGNKEHLSLAYDFSEYWKRYGINIPVTEHAYTKFWDQWNHFPLAVYDINVQSRDKKILTALFSEKNKSWAAHKSMPKVIEKLIG